MVLLSNLLVQLTHAVCRFPTTRYILHWYTSTNFHSMECISMCSSLCFGAD